jgi:hypothetical protein
MKDDIEDIEITLRKLQLALNVETVEEWDKIINDTYELENNQDSDSRIYIRFCGETILDRHSKTSNAIEFLVAIYGNIRITIDTSRNHGRPHIHIGIKKDKYHSASIAIDNGEIINNSGNIDNWKVNKILDWVKNNKTIIEKIWRCVNTWGDSDSAEKRKNKLNNI